MIKKILKLGLLAIVCNQSQAKIPTVKTIDIDNNIYIVTSAQAESFMNTSNPECMSTDSAGNVVFQSKLGNNFGGPELIIWSSLLDADYISNPNNSLVWTYASPNLTNCSETPSFYLGTPGSEAAFSQKLKYDSASNAWSVVGECQTTNPTCGNSTIVPVACPSYLGVSSNNCFAFGIIDEDSSNAQEKRRSPSIEKAPMLKKQQEINKNKSKITMA